MEHTIADNADADKISNHFANIWHKNENFNREL